MIPFEFGVRYVGNLRNSQVGPLSGPTLWNILKDGRTLGFMARHIMEETFSNVIAMPDEFGYSLTIRGTGDVMQTRMVTRSGCDLLMSKMKGVGRHEQKLAQAEWERSLTGWVLIDNRDAPNIIIAGARSIPRDKSTLRVSDWERMVYDMPRIRLDWHTTQDVGIAA